MNNVSRPNFVRGHAGAQERIRKEWANLLDRTQVFHVRMILNWGGFTGRDRALASRFTEEHPEQPLFLICPSRTTGPAIYGKKVYSKLHSKLKQPAKPRAVDPLTFHPKELQFMQMTLELNENWKEYLDQLQEEYEESEEFESEG